MENKPSDQPELLAPKTDPKEKKFGSLSESDDESIHSSRRDIKVPISLDQKKAPALLAGIEAPYDKP